MSKKINKIIIKHILDTDPDLSFLKQDYRGADVTEEENERYQEQDKKRLESYGYTWEMIGIKAVAEIHITSNSWSPPQTQIHEISSGGLWGVESDSGPERFSEIEQEELNDLSETLQEFGFSKDEIDKAPMQQKEVDTE